jgi:hypothetical protein
MRGSLIFWSAIPIPCGTGCAEVNSAPAGPLSRPRNVAELCLAFEVHRMLMQVMPGRRLVLPHVFS